MRRCTLTPAQILALKEEGLSFLQIAARAGVCRQRISQIYYRTCARLDLPVTPGGHGRKTTHVRTRR